MGRYLFVAVDGRQASSVGMTVSELPVSIDRLGSVVRHGTTNFRSYPRGEEMGGAPVLRRQMEAVRLELDTKG